MKARKRSLAKKYFRYLLGNVMLYVMLKRACINEENNNVQMMVSYGYILWFYL